MRYKNLIVEKKEGIAIIEINRPALMNALNSETLREFKNAIENVREDTRIKVLVITGRGKAFSAGGDIGEMKDMNVSEARSLSRLAHDALELLENLDKPVIAAINGYAVGGGCEIIMACDFRIASENAKFGQPEINLGIIPGGGGTQRMPRIVGKAKAKELILTGDIIDAREAERIGLVNKVVPKDKLEEEVTKFAKKLMSKSPMAVAMAKSAIDKGIEMDLKRGLSYEISVFSSCFSSNEQKELMKAFLRKREINKK